MNYRPPCAVCERGVDPSTDHVVLEAEWKHINDRDELDEYYLHDRCAMRVIGGWREP